MVVLIAGVTSGLGVVMADYFTKQGMTVYGTSRSADKKVKGCTVLPMTITDSDSITQTLQTILDKEGRLDAVVNCINMLVIGGGNELSVEEFRKVYDINVVGAFDLSKQAVEVFKKWNKGVVVNMSSLGGILAIPYFSAYTSSKMALESMSESLYHELKDTNIDVVVMQSAVMHMDRPALGSHIMLANDIPSNSKSHAIVDMMENDTKNSKTMPIDTSKMVYKILVNKKKRPLRVRVFEAKKVNLLKRIAPQSLVNKILYKVLPI